MRISISSVCAALLLGACTGKVPETITINPAMSDFSNVTYKLVKLTSKEMEWQKEGTTYSVGTWGSDYRHFVRGK